MANWLGYVRLGLINYLCYKYENCHYVLKLSRRSLKFICAFISYVFQVISLGDFFPEDRPTCGFGSECFRLNPDHLRWKKHEHSKTLFKTIIRTSYNEFTFIASKIFFWDQKLKILRKCQRLGQACIDSISCLMLSL